MKAFSFEFEAIDRSGNSVNRKGIVHAWGCWDRLEALIKAESVCKAWANNIGATTYKMFNVIEVN